MQQVTNNAMQYSLSEISCIPELTFQKKNYSSQAWCLLCTLSGKGYLFTLRNQGGVSGMCSTNINKERTLVLEVQKHS